MGVPEQLRRLDEDLATGRVDADSYRRRRDEILAARLPPPPSPHDHLDDSELDAAERELGFDPNLDPGLDAVHPETGPPRGVPAPLVEAPPLPETRTSALRPPPTCREVDEAGAVERTWPADPFPPPFRWSAEAADGDAESPDTARVVHDAGGPAVERTPVVPRGEAGETQVERRRSAPPQGGPSWPGTAGSAPLPERMQFVRGAVPARAAGGGVARPEETAPPWADAAAARSEGRHGRELFARGPGPRPGAILGTVAVLLLVAIVLVASFVLA